MLGSGVHWKTSVWSLHFALSPWDRLTPLAQSILFLVQNSRNLRLLRIDDDSIRGVIQCILIEIYHMPWLQGTNPKEQMCSLRMKWSKDAVEKPLGHILSESTGHQCGPILASERNLKQTTGDEQEPGERLHMRGVLTSLIEWTDRKTLNGSNRILKFVHHILQLHRDSCEASWMTMLPPSSNWRRMQYGPPKRWYHTTTLQSLTTQKTETWIFIAVRRSEYMHAY